MCGRSAIEPPATTPDQFNSNGVALSYASERRHRIEIVTGRGALATTIGSPQIFALIPSFVMPVTNRPLWRNLPNGVRY
jgi:hypothetical protein